jgi:hypothetical protein
LQLVIQVALVSRQQNPMSAVQLISLLATGMMVISSVLRRAFSFVSYRAINRGATAATELAERGGDALAALREDNARLQAEVGRLRQENARLRSTSASSR